MPLTRQLRYAEFERLDEQRVQNPSVLFSPGRARRWPELLHDARRTEAEDEGFRGAKSPADFVSKMTTVEEEADEARYWLEVLVETSTMTRESVAGLLDEAEQLVCIIVASIKTARGHGR